MDHQLYSIEEIEERLSQYESKTVRYAVRRLLEHNLIESIPYLEDMRTVRYQLRDEASLNEALAKLPPEISSEFYKVLKAQELQDH